MLADHGVAAIKTLDSWGELIDLHPSAVGLVVLGIEQGFETEKLAVISEQDILGDRLVRRQARQKRAANFIAEAAALNPDDLVVHVDHGIGRYLGLKTIEAAGAPHDCLEIQYDGGKLFLPVEISNSCRAMGRTRRGGSRQAWPGRAGRRARRS